MLNGTETRTILAGAIEHVAHVLPAQGPITVFIHHNTLHSFEHLPFEEAVFAGGELLGCEPFLAEDQYRAELRSGRIEDPDLEAVLRDDLGDQAARSIGGFATRHAMRSGWLRHGVPVAAGPALEWLLFETDVLDVARRDLPLPARDGLLGGSQGSRSERAAVRGLWEACLRAVSIFPRPRAQAPAAPLRHRDFILLALGADSDTLVHPLLIRLCAAYLDQGIAVRAMPDRELGFHRCVTRLYGLQFGSPAPWMQEVRRLMSEEAASGRSAHESIERSLRHLGVDPADWSRYLVEAALALRGWAGMMRQVEVRPDRMPVHAPPATLADFLAIRLLLDRAAAAELARPHTGRGAELARLREVLADRMPAPGTPSDAERAWPWFHLAQILGKSAADILALPPESVRSVLAEIESFDGSTRRRLLHLAFEQSLRRRFYDAVAGRPRGVTGPARDTARFQAMFCIDEREESIRRHLEEVAPSCETYGAVGYFGVAMYYRGADEAHARPLCPVGIRPEHEVEEIRAGGQDRYGVRSGMRRAWGRFGLGMALGSRSVVGGAVGTVVLGALAAIPLVFRVLAPRLAARLLHGGRTLLGQAGRHELALERRDTQPSVGRYAGFTTDEMAGIVRRLFVDSGLSDPAPLVLIVGHGSTSLNNPHEAAHDCGACGGGRGGPNARAFARMANNTEVRRRLAAEGLTIPERTWFVGAEHNSATDAIDYFDLHRVPEKSRSLLREAIDSLQEACQRNAHERCRRFKAAPLRYTKRLCLSHVQTRAEDLAQTRPEYGHATNAFCVVGRRHRTRELFLDRRAFLVSYDPERDDDGATVLARVLAGIVPVVAGISLEYYFAVVDPIGYGCGTKLPHNVTALLGVMDGHASDLRTGLPRQMVEIHEPVRLTLLVETPAATLERLVRENSDLRRLVANRWIVAAALDPASSEILELSADGVTRHEPAPGRVGTARSSAEWYQGRRGFLGFALIEGGSARTPNP